MLSAVGSLSGFGPALFIILHNQQLIKTLVLIGNPKNTYSVEFLQGGFNIDLDFIPYDYLPKLTVKKKVIEAKLTDEKY